MMPYSARYEVEGVSRTNYEPQRTERGYRMKLRESRLGLLDGLGALTLVRDSTGEVVSARGAWRPVNEDLDLEALRELFRPGAALTYQGPALDESAADEWSDVRLEVEITGVERCGEEAEPAGSSHMVHLAIDQRPRDD